MNDTRRGALLIASSILAARKIALVGPRSSPALECAIADAITMAEKILNRIDAKFPPENPATSANSTPRLPTN